MLALILFFNGLFHCNLIFYISSSLHYHNNHYRMQYYKLLVVSDMDNNLILQDNSNAIIFFTFSQIIDIANQGVITTTLLS